MLIPHRNLLLLAALWFALGVVLVFAPERVLLWQGGGALVLALALADALAARGLRGSLAVRREMPHAWPVGSWQTVSLRLASPQRRLSGWLYDRHPAAFRAEGLPLPFTIEAGHWLKAGYRLQVTERGRQAFGRVELRLVSPFRLWLVRDFAGEEEAVRVYPDFARVTQYTLLATDNRLSQIGVLRRRRRGQGLEFHQLRDYRQDDPPRRIDWKASARARRLISREYQDERDQQIVFLLDCGSRMRAKDDALSHFDHTLNALLLLAYVALRQGDAVGLATFGADTPRFLPPRKSVAMVTSLLNAVYDLQPTLQTSDYLAACEQLAARLSRRALIVLVTNLRDEDDDTLRPALELLRRRHAVSLASLREAVLDSLAEEPIPDFDGALAHAAALEYRRARQKQVATLRKSGVHVLDVQPAALPIALINHYWDLKRAGVL